MQDHANAIGGLREAVSGLEGRLTRLEDRVDRGFERVDQRFDSLDGKMSRQFHWTVGLLMSGLIAMMGTLGGIIAVLIRR